MPSPPTSTCGCSIVRACWQTLVANASSEPCMRLDIRVRPFTRMTYSLPRLVNRMALPSGVHVSPSSSQAIMTPDPKF